jgi:hypothetical protein
MKLNVRHFAIIASAVLLFTTAVASQTEARTLKEPNLTEFVDNGLGDDVRAYKFNMKGLPAPAADQASTAPGEEVDAEKEIDREPDNDESFNITEEKALEIAREALGSSEWNLTSSQQTDDGLYEFEFTVGESEAEVVVDGSSGKIVELEGEIEYEPEETERDSATVSLNGFVLFESSGNEIETESEVENGTVDFTVTIESEDESEEAENSSENETEDLQPDRVRVSETEDVEPGRYTATLEVNQDGETLLTREEDIKIPETGNEDDEDERQDPEEMSRDELVEEVKSLRERVQELEERLGIENRPSEEEGDSEPVNETTSGDDAESESETGETGTSDETPEGQGPQGASGENSNRPGFVDRMLGGLLG